MMYGLDDRHYLLESLQESVLAENFSHRRGSIFENFKLKFSLREKLNERDFTEFGNDFLFDFLGWQSEMIVELRPRLSARRSGPKFA